MAPKTLATYGSWKSPITTELIVSDGIGFTGLTVDGEDVYWIEMRPSEGGRNVIVRRSTDGEIVDITPPGYNARNTVHEYGGGAMMVNRGTVLFSNFDDQKLYMQSPGKAPKPLSAGSDMRFADGVIDPDRGILFCIREDHSGNGEAVNTLVKVDMGNGGMGEVIVEGNDFYAAPRLSPDGCKLAWITWNHPDMPWHGTELWVADVNADGSLGSRSLIAGGKEESILRPEWSPSNDLYFVSDVTGWCNLYRWRAGVIDALCKMDAEFAGSSMSLVPSEYAFASDSKIVCAFNKLGTWYIAKLDTESLKLEELQIPFTDVSRLGLHAYSGKVVFSAGSPTEALSIVELDLDSGNISALRNSKNIEVSNVYLSVPEAIEFPTDNGLTAHAFFYAPKNGEFDGLSEEKPPLLVISHGGPTGATSSTLKLETQYWTSRGIAVVDVNYGGSLGYGRAYRERLDGNWGIVDVNDCVNAAKYLSNRGDIDGDRLMIRGGSAGGYTTLAALAFTDAFKAGASYYGLSELETFIEDTHKFESRYLNSLIGPYPSMKETYYDRSPINHVDKLSCPLILLQGLEDKIVPPNQAELMLDALRKKGLPVAYVPFEGEQHGFRRSENIKRSMEAELYFYSRVFNFPLADVVEPVHIENMD
jgi:dipeptidyl aminopeptidase/acylaminoacyl peptidase